MQFIRQFAPRRFDKFDFVPSIGASGGILILWNSAIFSGATLDNLQFGLTIAFTSLHNAETWKMTSVYGPCIELDRTTFVNWLHSHSICDDEN